MRSRRLANIDSIGRPRNAAVDADSARVTTPRAGIVNAATKLFSEKGYAQTTMSDIAGRRVCSIIAVLLVSNKEQLLRRPCWSTGRH